MWFQKFNATTSVRVDVMEEAKILDMKVDMDMYTDGAVRYL